jgi:transcriptional antiterminator NusG
MESNMKWYALFVETGQEEKLKQLINTVYPDDDIKILIPQRKLKERRQGKTYEVVKKLFPGYVLINTVMAVDMYYRISKLPMVYSILKDESEPVPIRDEDMAVILALTSRGDTIGFSEVYKEGDRIVVVDGPLKGLEGIIERFDARKNRIKVCIQFLGNEKCIDLGAHLVNKCKK